VFLAAVVIVIAIIVVIVIVSAIAMCASDGEAASPHVSQPLRM
jgi:hypothetical protein